MCSLYKAWKIEKSRQKKVKINSFTHNCFGLVASFLPPLGSVTNVTPHPYVFFYISFLGGRVSWESIIIPVARLLKNFIFSLFAVFMT